MELLEGLELVEVTYDNKKAVLTFLDSERGEIREVNFNKQVYDQEKGEFVDSDEKAEKVEGWCQEYFGLSFERLPEAIGECKDVYAYSNFNSLYPVKMVNKFGKEMVGQIFETEVTAVIDDGKAIHIEFEYEGETYESKMQYADYLEAKKQWFINPIKQQKQYDKFEQNYHINIANKEELVGKKIMVEVKLAFKKFVYCEIKKFPQPKN